MTPLSAKPLTGKHVFVILLGFFGTMLAVNTVFLVSALSTFNGGEGGKAYQAGLRYNQTIAAARAQDRLGWSHGIEAGAAGEVRVLLQDSQGKPVGALVLAGEIARPVAEKFTRGLVFKELQPGLYVANAGPLDAGNWVVSFSARPDERDPAILYRAKERLWLKPNS